MAIIGIDLGTTNSLACACREGKMVLIPNSLGQFLTPSAVSVEEDGSICVGAVAKERLISHPEASAASFKRFMGTDHVFHLSGQDFTPQELSSFVLRQLKSDAEHFLNEEVTEAVISVPAYLSLSACRRNNSYQSRRRKWFFRRIRRTSSLFWRGTGRTSERSHAVAPARTACILV